MLIGQYGSKLTDRNRISVPKKIRDELGNELIITRWYEGCLVLVSRQGWLELITRLVGRQKLITQPVRDIDRFIFASAFEVDVDGQGRFVLPDELRFYADVKSEVVFIGLGDRAEVWSSERWHELEGEVEKKANAAIEKIASEERRRGPKSRR